MSPLLALKALDLIRKRDPNADTSKSATSALVLRFLLRLLQFVLAITVCGLYGQDLHSASKLGAPADSKWVYAVVIGGMSALSVVIYAIPMVQSTWFWFWDSILFILWTAAFGVFGKLYINEDPESVGSGNGTGPDIQRMKNAVWVNLINMLLWFITAAYGASLFIIERRQSLAASRSKV